MVAKPDKSEILNPGGRYPFTSGQHERLRARSCGFEKVS